MNDSRADISTREDIDLLVSSFYEKALVNEQIGFIFTEIAQIDLKSHLPRIADFWESTILSSGSYVGNTMAKHLELAQKVDLKALHFQTWLMLWKETVHQYFIGKNAEEAINRAKLIAKLMMSRIGAN